MQNVNTTDIIYGNLIGNLFTYGTKLISRNFEVISDIGADQIVFSKTPLVTVRKTAWKKAIREMEWFLSGDDNCPTELLDWWKGQLNKSNKYLSGYSTQFRKNNGFDQVAFVFNALRNNPNSRRIILSSWNPKDMANITYTNDNPNTPTCCHSTIVQFFVRDNYLHIKCYQRSADILLGLPHNWIQSWALLLYFALHSGLGVGSMTWAFGDLHLYTHETHLKCADEIIKAKLPEVNPVVLLYSADSCLTGIPEFKSSDFELLNEMPQPLVQTKPILL